MKHRSWRKKLLKIAQRKMDKFEIIHNVEHSLRVYENCKRIAKHYRQANLDVLYAASLLHDFGQTVKRLNEHGKESTDLAKKILLKIKFPEKDIPLVLEATKEHDNFVWIKTHSQKKPKSIETKIFQDADRLETIGAIGIARNFAWAGKNDKKIWDRTKPLCPQILYGNNYSVIHTLHSELRIYNHLNTQAAKKLARKRQIFLKQFIKQFLNEWNFKF